MDARQARIETLSAQLRDELAGPDRTPRRYDWKERINRDSLDEETEAALNWQRRIWFGRAWPGYDVMGSLTRAAQEYLTYGVTP